ncbi:MAG: DUF1559 domain-containing protein [Candidatus Nanopelagicales bacterium]|nr:DUF1559 domain-containing protein [Candidatus Nanopelagicales bacterium]
MKHKRLTIGLAATAAVAAVIGFLWYQFECWRIGGASTVRAKSRGLDFGGYASVNGVFPPRYLVDSETGARHSWRVLILPFIYCGPRCQGYSFQESWDSPNNQAVFSVKGGDHSLNWYVSPASSGSREMTNYVAIYGEDTLWPEPDPAAGYSYVLTSDSEDPEAESYQWPVPKGREVSREWYGKIAFVELLESDIRWAEPRDVPLDQFLAEIEENPYGRFYNKWLKGILAVTAGANVVVIDPHDSIDNIRRMFVVTEQAKDQETGVPQAPVETGEDLQVKER